MIFEIAQAEVVIRLSFRVNSDGFDQFALRFVVVPDSTEVNALIQKDFEFQFVLWLFFVSKSEIIQSFLILIKTHVC